MSRLYTNDVLNQVKLPNNSTYDINDTLALHLLGITETDVTVTDPSVPSQVVIGSATIDVVPNDAVVCSVKDNAMYRYKQTGSNPATYAWENISPTAATIGNGTITVTTTGESNQTFTVNQTSNSTISIPVPVKGIQVAGTDLTPDNNTHKVNITAIPAANITAGVLADGFTTTTPTSESADTALVTKEYVDDAIAPIAAAMVFKGTVGTDGTIANLPNPAADYLGWVYKAVSDNTTATAAIPQYKAGDTLICAEGPVVEETQTYKWVVIPSGDEPVGTVTNIATGDGLTGGPITDTGTIGLALVNNHTTTVAAGDATSTADRSYPVAIDSNNKLAVNVPWTDTTQIPVANITDVVANASASLISAIDNPIKTISTADADTSSGTPAAPSGAVATDLFTVTSGVLTIKYLTATTAPAVTATTTENLVQKVVTVPDPAPEP